MRKYLSLLILVLFCIYPLLPAWAERAVANIDSFSGIAEGTSLNDLPGWKGVFDDGAKNEVCIQAGYTGTGLRIKKGGGKKILTGEQIISSESGRYEFHMKIRFVTQNDAYAQIKLIIGQDDGVNGLVVRFNGGSSDGLGDNFVEVSSGGKNWGRIDYAKQANAKWKKETWYEIVISDIQLADKGQPAKLSISELGDSPSAILEAADVYFLGNPHTFGKINLIQIANDSTTREFDIDDLSLLPLTPR